MMNIKVKGIWYNPAKSVFEGRIDVVKGKRAYRYPCAVEGPMDMSGAEVRRRMCQQAMRMSDTPQDLYSHTI